MFILAFIFGVLACATVASAQGQLPEGFRDPLPLFYDAASGNVTIDTTNVFGGELAGWAWVVPCEPCDAFIVDEFTPFMNSAFASARGHSIGESNFSGTPGGVYSLGNVLPQGLTEAELLDTYFSVDQFLNSPLSRTMYFVLGQLGSRTQHVLEPIYSASPFPALNDRGVGPSSSVEAWATQAILRYNTATGDLFVDTSGNNGGAIFSYEIRLAEPVLRLDEFIPVHTPGLGGEDSSDDSLLEVSWEGLPPGNHLLGSVLPSGLAEDELESLIDFAQFLSAPGHDAASFDVEASGISMTIQFVPEPTTSWLALLSVACLFRARPRRF